MLSAQVQVDCKSGLLSAGKFQSPVPSPNWKALFQMVKRPNSLRREILRWYEHARTHACMQGVCNYNISMIHTIQQGPVGCITVLYVGPISTFLTSAS